MSRGGLEEEEVGQWAGLYYTIQIVQKAKKKKTHSSSKKLKS